MDIIKYSINIVEDISDEQYSKLVNGFKEYFNKKGFKVKSIRKYKGSTEIVFILEPLIEPEALSAFKESLAVAIIVAFGVEIIKYIYRKIKGQILPKLKTKTEKEILYVTSQEISYKPEILQKHASNNIIAKSFKEPIRIANRAKCSLKQIKIEYDKPDFEKLDMLIKKEPQYRKLSVDIKYETYYKKNKKKQIYNNRSRGKKT